MRRWFSATLCTAAVVLATAAHARTVRDQPFSRDNTWNAAIRLIRVDLGCRITERDPESGYFTFDWRDGQRTVPGSIEVIPTQVDGRPGTRVIVQISSMPTYVESMVLTQLRRKLVADFGEPVVPRRPESPPLRPDPPLGTPPVVASDAGAPVAPP